MCHEKITKIKMITSQDIRDTTLIDIQFHLSDLNLKILIKWKIILKILIAIVIILGTFKSTEQLELQCST